MMARILRSLGVAVVASLWLAAPAGAGGWAVTTLDPLPTSFEADATYLIGYTIRQHGERPFNDAQPRISIRSGPVEPWQHFDGQPTGAAGHYVSKVRFPAVGTWDWQVDQRPFAPQKLGQITVVAPRGARGSDRATPVDLESTAEQNGVSQASRDSGAPTVTWSGLTALRIGLTATTTVAFGGFVLLLARYRRGRRGDLASAGRAAPSRPFLS
ncbi:MAG: hypothetical protein HY329_23135 [Chloroflexi bacterium]|nr:hypothetical protein [Chloroflexota bacterium]